MKDTDKQKAKKWASFWEKAQSALALNRIKELRAYDYNENRQIVDDMLKLAVKNISPRPSSGLVSQQKLFSKLRKT